MLALALGSCSDPPDPPPLPGPPDLPRWSTAPYVRWAGPSTPVDRPLAIVVDQPGGPADLVVADADVTTFLNDRFIALFLVPDRAGSLGEPGTLQVVDPDGCWRLEPLATRQPAQAIAGLNAALTALAEQQAPVPRPQPPRVPGFAPEHPVHRPCPSP